MNQPSPEEKPQQYAHGSGNITQIGRDNIQTSNWNFWIPIVLVIAMGALAYLGIRFNPNGFDVQIQEQQNKPAPSTSPSMNPQ